MSLENIVGRLERCLELLEDPRLVPERDLELGVKQLSFTIRRQLVECPPFGCKPVEGLTDNHIDNLARTIANVLDEIGKER